MAIIQSTKKLTGEREVNGLRLPPEYRVEVLSSTNIRRLAGQKCNKINQIQQKQMQCFQCNGHRLYLLIRVNTLPPHSVTIYHCAYVFVYDE